MINVRSEYFLARGRARSVEEGWECDGESEWNTKEHFSSWLCEPNLKIVWFYPTSCRLKTCSLTPPLGSPPSSQMPRWVSGSTASSITTTSIFPRRTIFFLSFCARNCFLLSPANHTILLSFSLSVFLCLAPTVSSSRAPSLCWEMAGIPQTRLHPGVWICPSWRRPSCHRRRVGKTHRWCKVARLWRLDLRQRRERWRKRRRQRWHVISSSRACRRLRSQSRPWLWRQVWPRLGTACPCTHLPPSSLHPQYHSYPSLWPCPSHQCCPETPRQQWSLPSPPSWLSAQAAPL